MLNVLGKKDQGRERWLCLVPVKERRVPAMDGVMVVAATGAKPQLWLPLWPLS